ncbi:uncharacterized protein [Palaemon carinicauda]|uniref:uncharacterized protein n=1 Tax=Palaemon carinicauda TaxID=392227 RepID=UPI0035B5D003
MDSRVSIFPQPQHSFSDIHVNVVGLLPTSRGNHYLFSVIDRSTRWFETIPMQPAMSASHTLSLLSGRMARFGIPEHITSDMDTTFTSQLWTSLANVHGITLHQTTAYNPAAKGMVKSFYYTHLASLMSRGNESNWFTQLSWFILGL